MTGRCPCPICNAPEEEPSCFDCGAPLDYDDAYEDAKFNPICGKCYDKAGITEDRDNGVE